MEIQKMINEALEYFSEIGICADDEDIVNFICDEYCDGDFEKANRLYEEELND